MPKRTEHLTRESQTLRPLRSESQFPRAWFTQMRSPKRKRPTTRLRLTCLPGQLASKKQRQQGSVRAALSCATERTAILSWLLNQDAIPIRQRATAIALSQFGSRKQHTRPTFTIANLARSTKQWRRNERVTGGQTNMPASRRLKRSKLTLSAGQSFRFGSA